MNDVYVFMTSIANADGPEINILCAVPFRIAVKIKMGIKMMANKVCVVKLNIL